MERVISASSFSALRMGSEGADRERGGEERTTQELGHDLSPSLLLWRVPPQDKRPHGGDCSRSADARRYARERAEGL